MRGLRRGKAPFAGIWLRQIPCLKRLLSWRRQGNAPPAVLRAARSCAASDKCFRKRACCPRVGHGFCADNAKSFVQSARTAHRAGAHTALFTLFAKIFSRKIFWRVLWVRICSVRNDGKQGKRHNFGCAYIEPLALVRHGCGILLQAAIPCTCRACAACGGEQSGGRSRSKNPPAECADAEINTPSARG